MGMSSRIIAFRPPDEQWRKMAAIWNACVAAGVDCPREVSVFFQGEEPIPEGVEVEINEAVEPWNNGDMQEGFQVCLEKLPPNVKYIRFINSY